MIDIEANIAAIKARIQKVSTKINTQSNTITLVAVSKKQPIEAIQQASLAGQKHFGENYLQEAVEKICEINDATLVWHFLGRIQSNKTAAIAENFDWVHSVDSLKVAQRLSRQRPDKNQPLNVCLQVNIDADPSKSGVTPAECLILAKDLMELPRLRFRGLMTVPAMTDTADQARNSFAALRKLFEEVQQNLQPVYFDSLSMGMTEDMEVAIEEGATMVRIGTAIFGKRSP